MKITITNAYTWYNKGDAGILLATIDLLKDIYKEVEFDILSFTPEEDSKRYCKIPEVKNVYSNILNPHPYKHTKVGKIIAIIKLFFSLLKNQIIMTFKRRDYKNKTLSSLENADLIIVCGGGFLGGKKLDSLMHLYQIYVNTKFKKPVYIMGTSIEPTTNIIVEKFTNFVLKKVDFIFAREKITEEHLKSIIKPEKLEIIPDMAFYLKDVTRKKKEFEKERKKSKLLLGITVRKWNFPQSSSKKQAMDNYINSVCQAMEYLIDKYNCIFIFIPQVIVEHGDDAEVALEIKSRLTKNNQSKFIIRRDDWSPYEIKEVIGELDGFIGTRMHSNIFAASKYIPTVAIAYEKKTNGIMETLKLEDYIVEIDDISSSKLVEKIEVMLKNRKQIEKNLKIRVSEIKAEIFTKVRKKIKGE